MDAIFPARKAHARELSEKNLQHFEHLRTKARTGRYEEEVFYKAGLGTKHPRVQR
jgi:hypothetical protein